MTKKIHIISGGTIAHIATHLALSAPAYGNTGVLLEDLCEEIFDKKLDVELHETKMAAGSWADSKLETNNDVLELVNSLVEDLDTKIIFMPVALCDFVPLRIGNAGESQKAEKGGKRLVSRRRQFVLTMEPSPKIIETIRQKRKDIFLVGFKTTDGVTEDEQYRAGLGLLKGASCNLVLSNDVKTRVNMVITPEEARYHVTTDRQEALRGLVEMTKLRSHLTFTRSTVVAGEPVPWSDERVPAALREVVDHLIAKGAYKPFQGATVGHFACKLPPITCGECLGSGYSNKSAYAPTGVGMAMTMSRCRQCNGQGTSVMQEFLTSQRKTNFNDLAKLGLVLVKTDGPDTVLAYGAKPSVGGQSQRILFGDHPEYDCVVHAHVPLKNTCQHEFWYDGATSGRRPQCGKCNIFDTELIPTVSQREFECGSHQCGKNTSDGMKEFTLPGESKIMAVFLAEHGPNILFDSKTVDVEELKAFIDDNFDLSKKTGGYVS